MTEIAVPDAAVESRPKYPHLENLDRVLLARPDFLARPVTISEKIHGFNARVGRDADGALWYGGRNQAWDLYDPRGDALQGFRGFVDEVFGEAGDALAPGVTLYGEWAGKGVQRGIDYGDKRFFLFGERLGDGPVLSSGVVLDQHWLLFGLTTVPTIYEGPSTRLDVLDGIRRGESIVAPGQPTEGVVIAPVDPIFDAWGHQVIAKYKSPAFEERTQGSIRQEKADLTGDPTWIAAHDFAETYVNANRLQHVLDLVGEQLRADVADQLHEAWQTEPLDVKHTGAVLKAVNLDVLREEAAAYDALPPDARKMVGSALNRKAREVLQAARDQATADAVAEYEAEEEHA